MLLADTSVWISHLHRGDQRLIAALEEGRVLAHPFVIGELACGSLRQRETVLDNLGRLPLATAAAHEEVLHVVDRFGLSGTGVGWIDAHLLASAQLSDADLYTHDTALQRAWSAMMRRR